MTISEKKRCVTIFVTSDSAGETASKLAAVSMAQYPAVGFALVRRALVRDEDELVQVLEDAKKAEAMVLHAIISDHLVAITNQFFNEHQLFHFDILTPPVAEIERLTDVAPIREPGALHRLSGNYFKQIEAMEFAIRYNDSKDLRGFLEAGMLLLDASRTSKAPLSLFLASKNLEVTNLPLIPEAHLLKQLFEVDPKKIVGLTNDPNVLSGTREERMRAYELPESTSHSDTEKIRRELAFTNDLYQKLGYVVIDAASFSIEETASMILNTLSLEDHSYYSTETSED